MDNQTVVAGLGLLIAAVGAVLKITADMRTEIQQEAVFHTRTDEKLKLLDYRMEQIESQQKRLINLMDDLQGYMSSNSDWSRRKHQD